MRQIKKIIRLAFHKIKIRLVIPLGIIDKSILKGKLIPEWEIRIKDVIECPDNAKIKRTKTAGSIVNGKQFMHNGIPITLGGYYGSEIAQMLVRNRGVHEPQEEYAFDLVLKEIGDKATMIELGCYWAFYSIWFLKKIRNGRSFLIEPDPFNLEYGKNNFRINKLNGDFLNAFVADHSFIDGNGNRFVSVADFIIEKKIEFVDILHSDIQGTEFVMLKSISGMIEQQRIGYFFISTHSDEVHNDCISFLQRANYIIVCEADLKDTFSYDGLIVAKSPKYPGISKIDISLRTKPKST